MKRPLLSSEGTLAVSTQEGKVPQAPFAQAGSSPIWAYPSSHWSALHWAPEAVPSHTTLLLFAIAGSLHDENSQVGSTPQLPKLQVGSAPDCAKPASQLSAVQVAPEAVPLQTALLLFGTPGSLHASGSQVGSAPQAPRLQAGSAPVWL